MERLKSKHFIVKKEYWVSFNTPVSFLGNETSSRGVESNSKHTAKLLQLQSPKNVKEVEPFIGLINFFGRMIPNHAAKIRFINKLRQKDKKLQWTNKCKQAFQSFIDKLSTKPLILPHPLLKEVTLTTEVVEEWAELWRGAEVPMY